MGGPVRVVDPLLEVGVVQQPEVAVVDQLVLLALAQRLDGQPQLLLGLVHRLVVEVGDPGVHPQHGLRDAQLVLARRRARSRRTCRAASASPTWPADSSISASPCLFWRRFGPSTAVRRRAPAAPPDWPISSSKRLAADRVSTVHGRDGLGGEVPGRRVVRRSARRRSGRRRPARRATVSSPYSPAPSLVDLAVGDQVRPGRPACPRSTSTSPGSNSRCDEPVGQRGQHLVVVEAAQQRQLASSRGMTRTSAPVVTNVDPPVADGVAQPAVDPVGAALGLHPRQHPQQPPRGDLLHLRHGLGRRRQVARGGRAQAQLRLAVRESRLRHVENHLFSVSPHSSIVAWTWAGLRRSARGTRTGAQPFCHGPP